MDVKAKKRRVISTVVEVDCVDRQVVIDTLRNGGLTVNVVNKPRGTDIDFIYLDGDNLFNKPWLFKLRSKLRPRLDTKSLLNKYSLCILLSREAPHTVPYSFGATSTTVFREGEVWILRANYGSCGKANAVVNSQESYDNAYSVLSSEEKKKEVVSNDRYSTQIAVLVSHYIQNPMLLSNKKFHLRVMYIMFVSDRNRKRSWIMNDMICAPAVKEYVNDNYYDQEVHDTHFGTNPNAFITNDSKYLDPVVTTMRTVSKCIMPQVTKFAEALNGYDVYGADVMLTSDGLAKLIEINKYPCLYAGKNNPSLESFPRLVWNAIYDTVVSIVFGTKKLGANITEL